MRLALGLLLCLPLVCHAWWNSEWSYRKKVTLDGSEVPALGGQIPQVLVPVRLHAGNFSFADAQMDGGDLRFVAADDKTPLNFHIEQYDSVNGIAIVWVQVPSVGGKDSAIYLYFGNPDAPAGGSSKSSFDAHTVAAFHFADATGLPQDGTGYSNHAAAFTGKLGANGALGTGIALASNQFMRIAASPSLATPPGTGWTAGLWLRSNEAAATGTVITRDEGEHRLVLGLLAGKVYLEIAEPGGSGRISSDLPIDGATWHHLAFSVGDRAVLYVDGHEVAHGNLRLPEFKGDILVGAGGRASGGIDASLDDLIISNMMRSADWIRANALAQDPKSKLAQYGEDERGGGSNYGAVLRTLLSAVSMDGWVVIALIGGLGALSLDVMVAKLRLLARVKRQNKAFVERFRDSASAVYRMDMAAANAHAQNWSDSPLFRVYYKGLHEVANVKAITGGVLTPQALEVVRAGMDAVIVEESQRLNSRLVLLTLSVSGAPFLGLLGTVVGIMITFASIAMAGDVNVNTIAPGVAAALTATVSGLAIAIPVLFGYNYVSTQIGEVMAAMEVFANELLGKLALQSSVADIQAAVTVQSQAA